MGGINRIQQDREGVKDARGSVSLSLGKEIFLKDGDQAFLTSAATGNEEDTLLDDIHMYTYTELYDYH